MTKQNITLMKTKIEGNFYLVDSTQEKMKVVNSKVVENRATYLLMTRLDSLKIGNLVSWKTSNGTTTRKLFINGMVKLALLKKWANENKSEVIIL
jgi:hypothetical protein